MKTKIKYFFQTIAFSVLLILFGGLACDEGINIFTPDDDIKLGLQLHNQISNSPSDYPILNDANAHSYVQEILNNIISSPKIKYRDKFTYKVTIIRRDDIINAFATPGGYIYVYTGLLKFLENEATLAGVIAHEVAHCERRHATQRMTKIYGASFLLDLVLGKNPSKLEEIAANLFVGLALLKNSRDDEYEADSYAFDYLKSTKWYPGALTFFFEKIKGNESNNAFAVLLSTHPLSQDRIDRLNKRIADEKLTPPNESNLFSERYKNFLKTLP